MESDGQGGGVRRSPRVLLTAAEISEAVKHHLKSSRFVFDVETTSLDTRNNELLWIGVGSAGRVDLIPCGHPKGVMLVPEHKEKAAAALFYPAGDPRALTSTGKLSMRLVEYTVPAVFARPPQQMYPHQVMEILEPLMFSDRFKLGHNVKFDLKSVAKYYDGLIPPPPYDDTIILRHVYAEDLTSYELKTLAGDWFGIPLFQRAKWYPNLGKAGVQNFGLDEVARYLAKDIRYCWLMFQQWDQRVTSKGLRPVYEFEMSVYPAIMAMEQAGFPVDLEQMGRVRADLLQRIAELEHDVWKMAGDQFPLSNVDAKRWVLFGEGEKPSFGKQRLVLKSQHLRVRSRTPKEKLPQVTQAVLEFYEFSNPMANALLEWSRMEKLRGTFIEGLSDKLNRSDPAMPTIHTGYKQHGTVTGRLSSAEPNLQQLPRGSTIRDLFVAGPGRTLIVADYDQIELRCAGFLAQDPSMMEVFTSGQDIHAQAAAAMYQIPLVQVTPDQRQVGKTQNFAVLYGAGVDKIAFVAKCSLERASQLIEGYFRQFPRLQAWMARELQLARKRGDRSNPLLDPPRVVIPPYGRWRRLPDLFELEHDGTRKRAERQAINAIVQGFASSITKMAMILLDQQLPDYAPMLAQVHDEIVVAVPEDEAPELLALVTGTMSGIKDPYTGQPILGSIPLVASGSTGTTWAAAKGK